MKERPILFSAPMVQALLAGAKTQTRRVAPISRLDIKLHNGGLTWGVHFTKPIKGILASHSGGHFTDLQARSIIASQFCPQGQPGDQLWVREAWTTHKFMDAIPPRDLTTRSIHYQADGQIQTGKNRPGMFMPRWASRIQLQLTAVRVERLQDISRGDAMEEGCPFQNMAKGPDPRKWYADLWDEINGPGAWDKNPFVWVETFEVLRTERHAI
jgi:hypothetical protein